MNLGYFYMSLAIIGTVTGQIFIKLASRRVDRFSILSLIKNKYLYFSFLCISLGPFLTNIALDYFELSVLYAFTGLNYVFTTLAAHLILKEELTKKMFLGIVFIAIGIFLYQF